MKRHINKLHIGMHEDSCARGLLSKTAPQVYWEGFLRKQDRDKNTPRKQSRLRLVPRGLLLRGLSGTCVPNPDAWPTESRQRRWLWSLRSPTRPRDFSRFKWN